MKLFKGFDAVKFPEENLIFIAQDEFLYYIYDPRYKLWRKHRGAGNDSITVSNYPDVNREELKEAMGGIFPDKETDFMRLCDPSQLCIGDMLALFGEDYPRLMANHNIYQTAHRFLLESDICDVSYLKLRDLFDTAVKSRADLTQVVDQIKDLRFSVIGRDIYKEEIGIVDGHDSSSYFWIMPVRVVDDSDTNSLDSIAEMRSMEISIEENDVAQYLTPFLYKHFDENLEANRRRVQDRWVDDDGKEQFTYVSGFEWYLTYNFFTFDSIKSILKDIADTMDALSSERVTEYTKELQVKRGLATKQLVYARDLNQEQIDAYNANRPSVDDTKAELLIDFYHRLIYRMEYMMKVGQEKGYDLISFMGP
jgi:hypothetical protein